MGAREREDKYASEKESIRTIYHDHKGRYGYRRVHLTLKNQGLNMNHKVVQRLMCELGLRSTVRPKKYRSYRGEEGLAAPNVLRRDFETTAPDEKWVTDVTEFRVKGEKVYLSPLIDLHTQEVVSYRASRRPALPLVTDMLKEAVASLSDSSRPVVHSDQGWQYRHPHYRRILANHGLRQSMSRKGNCLDNAIAECFFALLKTEMYHGHHFEDAEHLIREIDEYITYYNTKRIKAKLNGLTPIEYRRQALRAA